MKNSAVDILTGIRPTGVLTIANYLGAIQPIIELQKQGNSTFIFAADIHALTNNEPSVVLRYTNEVIIDCIALGLDPKKAVIYTQSSIFGYISALASLLARHITVAELLRVPTLKDKLKKGARPETANTLLLLYPVIMAADIMIQRARRIPVGEDQVAHLEITRELARRFNKQYGEIFPLPQPYQIAALRILALRGNGKMSKSLPDAAILLSDSPKEVAQKIKRAQTANAGEMTESLKSHITLSEALCSNDAERREIASIIKTHMAGKTVMKDFKQLMTSVIIGFLDRFHDERTRIEKNRSYIAEILDSGNKIAEANAQETIEMVLEAMKK